jgi:hypothetical protein
MNKNLGSLIFLAGVLLLTGIVVLLLQSPTAPRTAPGYAPPTAPRTAQLEEELRKTQAALERLNILELPPATAGQPSLADVFPQLASDASSAQTRAGAPQNASGPFESGYSVPINRNERTTTLPVRPSAAAPTAAAAARAAAAQAAAARAAVAAPAAARAASASAPDATQASVPPPPSPGRLAMTYVAPDLERAIVGDQVVHVGDTLKINGSRVLAITDAYITLRDTEGKRVRLTVANTETPAAEAMPAPPAPGEKP